jgi:hypothetical protein
MTNLMRNENGVAMTEAVIVIPFFLIIWMSIITLHHLYDGRLEAQTISLATALSRSFKGCTGDPSPVTGAADASAEIAPETSSWLSELAGEQPLGWTHTHGRCTITVSGIPGLFGGPEKEVRAEQTVICNMRPKDGIIDLVYGMVKSMLGVD